MKKRKMSTTDKTFNVFNYLLFGIFTLICIYPFYYMIINTISANDISAAGRVNFFPKGVHFNNYKALLEIKGLGSAALVSIGKTVIGTALKFVPGYVRDEKKEESDMSWQESSLENGGGSAKEFAVNVEAEKKREEVLRYTMQKACLWDTVTTIPFR